MKVLKFNVAKIKLLDLLDFPIQSLKNLKIGLRLEELLRLK